MGNDLLKFCRYFKGENEKPFDGRNQNKGMFWEYERYWVLESSKRKPNFSDMLTEYLNNDLLNFSFSDGVPTTLKSLLFNRYQKWNMSGAEGFKDFYLNEYLGC